MEPSNGNDLSQKYSKQTIIIHWLTAVLIIILFPLGKYMSGLAPVEKMGMIRVHVVLGAIVFLLTIFRSWLFFKAPRPADLKTSSKFNDKLAVGIHNAFYFLLFAIAVSGIVSLLIGGYSTALTNGSAELIQNRNEIPSLKGHGVMAIILMVLLMAHIIGVAKHYLTTKENVLKRMS